MHTSSLSNPRLCAIISWLPFSSFPSPFGPSHPHSAQPSNPLPFSSNITLTTYPGYTAANRDTHNLCDPSQCEPGSQASCVARRACSVDTHTRLCVLLVLFARSLVVFALLLTKIAVRCSGEPQGPVRKRPGFG
jgi:hypothetical protein